jgi:hypothetical protein
VTPLEPFSVITPLGPAICTGIYIAEDPEFLCWINSTQEPWWFGNPHIRRRPTVSNGILGVSPFSHINKRLEVQIMRYISKGWLPEDYDPCDTSTWRG